MIFKPLVNLYAADNIFTQNVFIFIWLQTSPNLKPKSEAKPTIIPGPVDKETLLMQEQLIQKQKELLELQQKKLELEVLQTQVKLQEQIKQTIPITSRSQVRRRHFYSIETNLIFAIQDVFELYVMAKN